MVATRRRNYDSAAQQERRRQQVVPSGLPSPQTLRFDRAWLNGADETTATDSSIASDTVPTLSYHASSRQRREGHNGKLVLLSLVVGGSFLSMAALIWWTSITQSNTRKIAPTSVSGRRNASRLAQQWWRGTTRALHNSLPQTHASSTLAVVEQPSNVDAKSPTKTASSFNQKLPAFAPAFSPQPQLSTADTAVLEEFARRVQAAGNQHHVLTEAVAWNGPGGPHWWSPWLPNNSNNAVASKSLTQLDGGFLLYCYFHIMQRYIPHPNNLNVVHFPFKLCKGKHGCRIERAITHTLEWRQTFKPWCVTPTMKVENKDGWMYVGRGLSRSSPDKNGAHAILWIRPGLHRAQHPLAYVRCILQALEQSIAAALRQSAGRVGSFNIVIDARAYARASLPEWKYIPMLVTMLQDHYPDRLGMVLMAHLSPVAEFVLTLIKPLITKEVRDKIHVLPHDPEHLLAELEVIVDRQYIPHWLGGQDMHEFDVDSYYAKQTHCGETVTDDFLRTMPYHKP